MGRAQAEVLGVVLLFGMVLVGAIAVATVGVVSLGSIQDQAESERDLIEIQNVAHEITSLSQADESRQVGVDGQYERVDGGQIIVQIDDEEVYNDDLGRLVKGDLVYEGGLVIQNDRVVDAPSFATRENTSQISFTKVSGDRLTQDIRRNDTTAIRVSDPTANVTIQVQSMYADLWYDAFEEVAGDVRMLDEETVEIYFEGGTPPTAPRVEAAVELSGGDGTVSFGEVDRLAIDSYKSSKGQYSSENRGEAGIISSPGDIAFGAGGGGTIDYIYVDHILSGGTVQTGSHNYLDEKIEENVEDIPESTPTEEILNEQNPEQGTEIIDSDLAALEDGGDFHSNGDIDIVGQDLMLSDSTSVFVNGDLFIERASIIAEEDLQLYVTGDIEFGDNSVIETAGNPHRSTEVGIFTTGDIIAGEPVKGNSEPDKITITGLLHASESTLEVNGDVEIYGSVTVDDIQSESSAQAGEFTLHYDEDLLSLELYEKVVDLSVEADHTRDSYYLNFVVTEIEAE